MIHLSCGPLKVLDERFRCCLTNAMITFGFNRWWSWKLGSLDSRFHNVIDLLVIPEQTPHLEKVLMTHLREELGSVLVLLGLRLHKSFLCNLTNSDDYRDIAV